MKNPDATYKELVEFADWVAQQRIALMNGRYANELNAIIARARRLTGETQPSDLTQRSNDATPKTNTLTAGRLG